MAARARAVSIAELKDKLSAYLGLVRGGEEILVRDRQVPIAKIVPLAAAEDIGAEEAALAAQGKLRLPQEPLPRDFWKRRRKTKRIRPVDPELLLKAIHEERER